MQRKTLTPAQIVVGLFFGVAVIGGLVAFNQPRSAEHQRVSELAAALERADSTGDRAAAVQLLAPSTALLQEMNTASTAPSRGCVLAAVAVGDGATEVANGGRWTSADRYQNAIASC